MTILIVDDTPAVAALIAGLLAAAGFGEPIIAHDAVEALNLLGVEPKAAPKIAVDLVLMDILMPEIDGIDACARLKADPRLADLPIIMISALSNADTLHRAFAAGAVDYIAKPIQAAELTARVGSALRTKRALDDHLVEGAAPVEPVTGLPTASVLTATLDNLLGREGAGALILLGLDDWSRFAAANGPAAADRAARQIADRLAALFGSLGDVLVRLDAGRFALLCRPATNADEAAQGLRRHVTDLGFQDADGRPLTATAAILPLDALAAGTTGLQAIALAVDKLAVESGRDPSA
jgi:PleD family two-component response regulator